jgi:hypothetical protein
VNTSAIFRAFGAISNRILKKRVAQIKRIYSLHMNPNVVRNTLCIISGGISDILKALPVDSKAYSSLQFLTVSVLETKLNDDPARDGHYVSMPQPTDEHSPSMKSLAVSR